MNIIWVFYNRRYHIFWEVVGLERGPLSLVSTTEELFENKSSCSGLENRDYRCRNPSRWPRGTLYPQKLALTWQTSGGRSVGIVRSQTQSTEYFSLLIELLCHHCGFLNGVRWAEEWKLDLGGLIFSFWAVWVTPPSQKKWSLRIVVPVRVPQF
jgi:hypothetical protein